MSPPMPPKQPGAGAGVGDPLPVVGSDRPQTPVDDDGGGAACQTSLSLGCDDKMRACPGYSFPCSPRCMPAVPSPSSLYQTIGGQGAAKVTGQDKTPRGRSVCLQSSSPRKASAQDMTHPCHACERALVNSALP
ncbi:hypothetical protein FSHL1_007245 [Fusarium sambucinum]